MTDPDAVSLLVSRFAFVAEMLEPQDYDLPFYAYERFAAEIHRRIHDKSFLSSAGDFIDELAATNDPLLENILWVTVLEKIAEDPGVATEMKEYIGPKPLAMLEEVERDFYGREPQRKKPR